MAGHALGSASESSVNTTYAKYLQNGGSGRMTMRNIQECFNINPASEKNKMITAAAMYMKDTYPGIGDLILRNSHERARKERTDAAQLSEYTSETERWFKRESIYKNYFGPDNTTVPGDCKAEAVRTFVFKAKQQIKNEVVREQTAIVKEDEDVAVKKETNQALQAEQVLHGYQDSESNQRSHLTVGVMHPLLLDRIENLSYYNVRILDSRDGRTITRLPFRRLVDVEEMGDALAYLDGGDIQLDVLGQFILRHCDQDVVELWEAFGNRLRVIPDGGDIVDSSQLAVSINDYINGARSHSDFCITLMLSELYTEDMEGKLNVGRPCVEMHVADGDLGLGEAEDESAPQSNIVAASSAGRGIGRRNGTTSPSIRAAAKKESRTPATPKKKAKVQSTPIETRVGFTGVDAPQKTARRPTRAAPKASSSRTLGTPKFLGRTRTKPSRNTEQESASSRADSESDRSYVDGTGDVSADEYEEVGAGKSAGRPC
ncbi:hypothetical protein NX059_012329 [Plenodomus lindquistii]|nr:hypothetical protein NX059_012329 [Plenodomus lindquistii]